MGFHVSDLFLVGVSQVIRGKALQNTVFASSVLDTGVIIVMQVERSTTIEKET